MAKLPFGMELTAQGATKRVRESHQCGWYHGLLLLPFCTHFDHEQRARGGRAEEMGKKRSARDRHGYVLFFLYVLFQCERYTWSLCMEDGALIMPYLSEYVEREYGNLVSVEMLLTMATATATATSTTDDDDEY